MLIWVMPWLIIRALDKLVDIIIRGTGKYAITNGYLALSLSTVIISGVCWCCVLYGFIKTAADPGPWDWSHKQAHQPEMAPLVPEQPSSCPPQGQNNNPQQHVYQPYTPPHAQV